MGEAEFTHRFGSLSNAELVEELYQGILGRASDLGGLQHFTPLLYTQQSTLATIGLDLLGGAQNKDAQTVANRLDFAKSFTQSIADSLVQYGPSQIQAAFDLMSTISDDGAVLSTALGAISELVLSFPAIGMPPIEVGDGQWNLIIAGTLTTSGVVVAIDDIVTEGLTADQVPSEDDLTDVENSIAQIYSEVGTVSNLMITVDSNADGSIAIATLFSATDAGVSLRYYLVYSFEEQ